MPMKIRIITPERVVFEDENVEAVYVRTTDGEVGILPRHIPMVASLGIGELRYVKEGRKESVAVMGGMVRTNGQEVSVLSDAAEQAEEIDAVRAREARERAEARLREKTDEVDVERARLALARSLARLKVKQPEGR
jgi:F-type H+-transporting ATPase subunit epsilon